MTSVPEGQKSLHGDVLQLSPLISGEHFTKCKRYRRELTVQLPTRSSDLINLSEHLVILRWILIHEIPELSFFTFKAASQRYETRAMVRKDLLQLLLLPVT